jgi:hypothetical protein
MAVSIDTVYQKVLAIANKEQRGMITPQEFNLFADQAQMTIFEQYFYDINQFNRVPGNDTSYSDMIDILEEKISLFEKTNLVVTNGVQLPNPSPLKLYKLQLVKYGDTIAEYISQKDYYQLKDTLLCKPTDKNPIYVKNDTGIAVFGNEQLRDNITCNYIRTPFTPNWAYVIVSDQALYNSTASVNFELHPSDENNLIFKILELAGISMGSDLYQIGIQEDLKEIQQQKK